MSPTILHYSTADFVPLNNFELSERFQDPQDPMRDDDLRSIHALSQHKATELEAELEQVIAPIRLRVVSETSREFFRMAREGTVSMLDYDDRLIGVVYTRKDSEFARTWLREVLPAHDTDIIVSWHRLQAVITRLTLFIREWDRFCHSSDNLAVYPLTCDWLLYHFCDSYFFFWPLGQKK